MQIEISAWYDDSKRQAIADNISDVFFYMISSTSAEERRHWALLYTKLIKDEPNTACNILGSPQK